MADKTRWGRGTGVCWCHPYLHTCLQLTKTKPLGSLQATPKATLHRPRLMLPEPWLLPPPSPLRADLYAAPNHHLGPGLAGTQGSPSSCHEAADGGRKRGVCANGDSSLCPKAPLSRPARQAKWTSSCPLSATLPPHSTPYPSTTTCRAPPSGEPRRLSLSCLWPVWAGGWTG